MNVLEIIGSYTIYSLSLLSVAVLATTMIGFIFDWNGPEQSTVELQIVVFVGTLSFGILIGLALLVRDIFFR